MTSRILGRKLKEHVIKSVITVGNIRDDAQYEIRSIDSVQLLVPGRADFLAKWLYIDYYTRSIQSSFGVRLYTETISAFTSGRFHDPDTTYKNSPDTFLRAFNQVIDATSDNKLDFTKILVPINSQGIVLDGAHRSVAAAYFNRSIRTVSLDDKCARADSAYFIKRGMPIHLLDAMMNVANCAVPDMKSLLVISRDKSIDYKIQRILTQHGHLYYTKSIKLSKNGVVNLVHYMDMLEIPIIKKFIPGNRIAHLYLFTSNNDILAEDTEKNLSAITALADYVCLSKTQQNSLDMGNILLNHNSIHIMNYAKPHKLAALITRLVHVERGQLPSYASTMTAYGIRGGSTGVELIRNDSGSLDDIMYNPENNLYIGKIQLPALHTARLWRKFSDDDINNKDMAIARVILAMKFFGELRFGISAAQWRARNRILWRVAYPVASRLGLVSLLHRFKKKN